MKRIVTIRKYHSEFIFIITIVASVFGYSQPSNLSDTLLKSDYKALYEQFYITGDKNKEAEKYAQAYLLKAKLDNDTSQVLTGYHLLADFHDHHYEIASKYVDSAITFSKNFKSGDYPRRLYGKKGYIERANGNFDKALDNYLKQLELTEESQYNSRHFIQQNIATLKIKTGYYNEAKSILKNCLRYEEVQLTSKQWDSSSFFSTIAELVSTYRLNKELDSAQSLHNQYMNTPGMYWSAPLFMLNDGILKYDRKNYTEAIKSLESAIPAVNNINNDFVFEIDHKINTYLFLGKSHGALNKEKLKIYYYKKIDSISETGYIIPETRIVYKELAEYYRQSGNIKQQLTYINKLIKADSIIDANYAYMSNKFHKQYDIPKLLSEKEKIITSLENERSSIFSRYITLFVILILTILFLGYYYYKQHIYKKRFEELLQLNSKKIDPVTNHAPINKVSLTLEIPEETINSILKKLNAFEQQHKYTKKNTSTHSLAKNIGTNTKYLSKIIHTYKEKSFKQYLNDLRIDYAIQRLKTDPLFRKYTIKAIAYDSGFNKAESFSKAFYKRTGIYPSYFIKKIT